MCVCVVGWLAAQCSTRHKERETIRLRIFFLFGFISFEMGCIGSRVKPSDDYKLEVESDDEGNEAHGGGLLIPTTPSGKGKKKKKKGRKNSGNKGTLKVFPSWIWGWIKIDWKNGYEYDSR